MNSVKFVLCDINESLCNEWKSCITSMLNSEEQERFVIFNDSLSKYNEKFDCIVSPANSICRLDGSFDYHISKLFDKNDVSSVTKHVQQNIYALYNGLQIAGTCALTNMHSFNESKHGCRYIATCPTMRLPSSCIWNKEVVYNCMWSLLCEIRRHNTYNGDSIKSVFMTGLGTGVGQFPPSACAAQMILAYRHFFDNLHKFSKTTSWNEGISQGNDIENVAPKHEPSSPVISFAQRTTEF